MEGVQVPGVLVLYFTLHFGCLIISGQIKIGFSFLGGQKTIYHQYSSYDSRMYLFFNKKTTFVFYMDISNICVGLLG